MMSNRLNFNAHTKRTLTFPSFRCARAIRFGEKLIAEAKREIEFHHETKQRLELANNSLNCMTANYNNSIKFRCSLCGFLTQCKSAVDSISEEINLRYHLIQKATNRSSRIYAISANQLISKKKDYLSTPAKKNSSLGNYIYKELTPISGWYQQLKHLRDEEAIHGVRISRNLTVGGGPHKIGIKIKIKNEILKIPDLLT